MVQILGHLSYAEISLISLLPLATQILGLKKLRFFNLCIPSPNGKTNTKLKSISISFNKYFYILIGRQFPNFFRDISNYITPHKGMFFNINQ